MRNPQEDKSHFASSWDMLMRTLYFSIFLITLVFIYLLCHDPIVATKEKVHSLAYIESINRKANLLESLEDEKKLKNRVENGIHLASGLRYDDNMKVVISACTSCHSAQLITQNRATKEGWISMIEWMQRTQGLPDLGSSEPIIVEYLAKHYAPTRIGRRPNLNIQEIEWYDLILEES